MTEVEIRPMRDGDVSAANTSAYTALRQMDIDTTGASSWPAAEDRLPERIRWSEHRVRHILEHDPAGSWVAASGDDIVGIALATKRESLWFLSLFTVSTALQGAGVGRRLLDACLTYSVDCAGAWIMSSQDPKALRRYHQAGFAMHPGYDASGTIDRSLLDPPSGPVVTEGEWSSDGEFVDAVSRRVRGAAYGPDQTAFVQRGRRLLRAEDGPDRGFAVFDEQELINIAATSPALGRRLLMEVAANLAPEAELGLNAVTAAQQWAIDAAMALRLKVAPGLTLCFRGRIGPMDAYLANGAYG